MNGGDPRDGTEAGPSPTRSCPLCQREIPPGMESRHHLVPRLRGGKKGPIAVLCRSCHSKIHSELTETELARHFSTLESLRSHPGIARFIRWIRSKPPDFQTGSPRHPKRRG